MTFPSANSAVRTVLNGGIILRRWPLVTSPLNQIEKKMMNEQKLIEDEKSFKSLHELRHEQDQRSTSSVVLETAKDFQLKCQKEHDTFFGKFERESIDSSEYNSAEMAPNENIYLTIKYNHSKYFSFPFFPSSTMSDQQQSLHDLTLNRFKESFKLNRMRIKSLGSHVPSFHYSYRYHSPIDGNVLNHLFFHKFQLELENNHLFNRYLQSDNIIESNNNKNNIEMMKWMTIKEMGKNFHPKFWKKFSRTIFT
ncbi:hypothetical protein SNEBB_000312 [Seison nebaliae]|nr:hypothetical protein SNEBB_000312 [Seison nebaliae]